MQASVRKIGVLTPLALALAVFLTGCGGDSKRADYKTAGQRTQALDVPPELTAPVGDERYTVADVGTRGATYSGYAGGKTGKGEKADSLLPNPDKLRIERGGAQRWLVAQATPEQLWPLLRKFLAERGLVVKLDLPAAGVLETDWAEKHEQISQGAIRDALSRALDMFYSSGERHRYRVRLEPGEQAGTTEIFVSHRAYEEVYTAEGKADTRWQPRASDPELEIEMLRRLMAFFGVEEDKAKVAPVQVATEMARVVKTDGGPLLEMDERFDRAWRRVGLVLDRTGFTVEDRDRTQGSYFVRFNDPKMNADKESKGFWSSLFGSDKTDPADLIDQFRIVLKPEGLVKTRVQVMAKDGTALAGSKAEARLLEVLRKELK